MGLQVLSGQMPCVVNQLSTAREFEQRDALLHRPAGDAEEVLAVGFREAAVAASRARGRVHGFEFVRQCWDELVAAGVDQSRIASEIVQPWIENAVARVETEITPDRLDTPRPAFRVVTHGPICRW